MLDTFKARRLKFHKLARHPVQNNNPRDKIYRLY